MKGTSTWARLPLDVYDDVLGHYMIVAVLM